MFFVVGVSSTVWPLTSGACLSACSILSHILYTESICVSLPHVTVSGCLNSGLCQLTLGRPLWLTSPCSALSWQCASKNKQPVVEEGRWTEELGSFILIVRFEFILLRCVCLLSEKSINKALMTKKEIKKSCRAPRPQLALSLLLMLLLNNYQQWLLLLLLLFLVFLFLLLYPITAMNDFMLSLLV